MKHRAILVTGHVLYFLGEVIDHGYEDKELAKEMKKGLPTEAEILEAWYDMPQKDKYVLFFCMLKGYFHIFLATLPQFKCVCYKQYKLIC